MKFASCLFSGAMACLFAFLCVIVTDLEAKQAQDRQLISQLVTNQKDIVLALKLESDK